MVNRAFSAAPAEKLQQHPLLFTTNRTDCMFFLWRFHTVRSSHPGHSTILLWLERPSRRWAKLHTVAASNNRDHMPWSLYCCLFVPLICGCCFLHTFRLWRTAHSAQVATKLCTLATRAFRSQHYPAVNESFLKSNFKISNSWILNMNEVGLLIMAKKRVSIGNQWKLWCTARILCFNKSFKTKLYHFKLKCWNFQQAQVRTPDFKVQCKEWFNWTFGVGKKRLRLLVFLVIRLQPKTSDTDSFWLRNPGWNYCRVNCPVLYYADLMW